MSKSVEKLGRMNLVILALVCVAVFVGGMAAYDQGLVGNVPLGYYRVFLVSLDAALVAAYGIIKVYRMPAALPMAPAMSAAAPIGPREASEGLAGLREQVTDLAMKVESTLNEFKESLGSKAEDLQDLQKQTDIKRIKVELGRLDLAVASLKQLRERVERGDTTAIPDSDLLTRQQPEDSKTLVKLADLPPPPMKEEKPKPKEGEPAAESMFQ
jgi:hypothetical protein